MKTCLRCGAELPPMKSRGNPRKWCSERCRIRAYEDANPEARERRLEAGRQRSAAKQAAVKAARTYATASCAQCGADFLKTRPDRIHCSKDCGLKASYARRKAAGSIEALMARRRDQAVASRRPCSICSRPLVYARNDKPVCRACSPIAARSGKSAVRRRAERRAAKAAAGVRLVRNRTFVSGSCQWCGEGFLCVVTNSDLPRWCSDRCKRAAKRSEYFMRYKGKRRRVTPRQRRAVHERDNWTCHICGDPVNRDAVAPALDAPVIDHVIALARGGTHSEDNWCTAHFWCNSVKRDLDLTEVA